MVSAGSMLVALNSSKRREVVFQTA